MKTASTELEWRDMGFCSNCGCAIEGVPDYSIRLALKGNEPMHYRHTANKKQSFGDCELAETYNNWGKYKRYISQGNAGGASV